MSNFKVGDLVYANPNKSFAYINPEIVYTICEVSKNGEIGLDYVEMGRLLYTENDLVHTFVLDSPLYQELK